MAKQWYNNWCHHSPLPVGNKRLLLDNPVFSDSLAWLEVHGLGMSQGSCKIPLVPVSARMTLAALKEKKADHNNQHLMASKFTITGYVIVRFWPNPHSFILGSQSSLFSQLDANYQFPTISDWQVFPSPFWGMRRESFSTG